MAQDEIIRLIPTSFDMWLACHLLTLSYTEALRLNVLFIIDSYIKGHNIDVKHVLRLRKYWFSMLTRGLTNEQIDELVNK